MDYLLVACPPFSINASFPLDERSSDLKKRVLGKAGWTKMQETDDRNRNVLYLKGLVQTRKGKTEDLPNVQQTSI